MRKINTTKKGFSLIELIIYMGLLSMLMIILSQLFTAIVQSKLASESSSSIDQDADYLISRLSYDVSRAKAINAPNNFSSVPSLTITVPVSGVDTSFTYALAGGNLQLTAGSNVDVLNSYNTSVSNLQFMRIGNGVTPTDRDTIRITFTLSSRVNRGAIGTESRNYQITVAPK